MLALETAPLWGFACGALTGCVLGDRWPRSRAGRWAAAGSPRSGPSGWQVGVVAALEVGVAAAVTAGVANWLRLRAAGGRAARARRGPPPAAAALRGLGPGDAADDGHTIYVDPWAGTADEGSGGARAPAPPGPSSLP